MQDNCFKALLLNRVDKSTRCGIQELDPDRLPEGDVLVRIEYSAVNYKDALAVTGRGKIVRSYPMVPGIDLAGRVVESNHAEFHPGQAVLATGWGLGERVWGGYAERARLPADWLLPLPDGLDTRRAMLLGTAGLTAMLCVMALEQGIDPSVPETEARQVVVSGASGGVGSFAVALLARLGYRVSAVSGRSRYHDYLRGLGAEELVSRAELEGTDESPVPPLASQRWAGAVDTVGGRVLAEILARMRYRGCVAACGLAGGAELHTSVMPFILRGVRLQGIESVYCPRDLRQRAWKRLAELLPGDLLDRVGQSIPLEQVPKAAEALLAGELHGRVVVELSGTPETGRDC
jgi:acrylyl-CoA reductase (NADPH)